MLEKIKTLLDISSNDTSRDGRISLILEQILEEFELFTHKVRKETFFKKNFKHSIIPISYPFVQKILKINGKEIPEKDYEILDNGTIFVKNASLIPHDDVIIVEFESGFEELPQKFLNDIFTLVIAEYSKENGKNIASEQLGPRSVTYEQSSNTNAENTAIKGEISARKRLQSVCIPPHLKIF